MISFAFLKVQFGGDGKADEKGRARVEAGDQLSNYITLVRTDGNLVQGDKVKNFLEKESITRID